MSDVFVSYKAEDRARVRPLVDALEADGLSVWWDAHLGGGGEWRDAIQQNLTDAACVIVVWSKRSVGPDGSFVRDEATRSLRRHVYLPVRIDKVEPPLGFGETQALPLIGWKGDRADPRYQALLGAARAIVAGKPHVHHGFVGADGGVSRRTLIAGGVASAVVAGVGGWMLLKPGSAAATDSIAVLPFANLSGDPGQAYFSDGMAEELRSALTRIARLKVIGRTSSELMRDTDSKAAANKLGVANILSGSVRRSPSTIRISAQLINGTTGIERWSETYDRAPGDALKIQSSIAENVANALSIQLGRVEKAALTLGGTANAAANDLYLKAVAAVAVAGSEADYRHALAMLDSAIQSDPNFAAAYARRATVLSDLAGQFSNSPEEIHTGLDRGITAANRAIELAPTYAPGHASLGSALISQLAIAKGLAARRKAYQLSPGDSFVTRSLAESLSMVGQSAEALQLADRAIALDPLNSSAFAIKAKCLLFARHFVPAIAAARQSLALAPARTLSKLLIASSLILLGRPQDALAELAKLDADDWIRIAYTAVARARMGERAAADRALAALTAIDDGTLGFQFAMIRAQRGEIDLAFAALDQAWTTRDPGLTQLLVEPFLDPLRNDLRYHALVAKLDFPKGAV